MPQQISLNELCSALNEEGITFHLYGLVFGEGLTELEIEPDDEETMEELKSQIPDDIPWTVEYMDDSILLKGEMEPYEP